MASIQQLRVSVNGRGLPHLRELSPASETGHSIARPIAAARQQGPTPADTCRRNSPRAAISSSRQLFPRHVQRSFNDLIHIIILILAQPAAKNDLCLGIGQRFVFCVKCAILFIVDGVIGLIALMPLGAVFPADHRFGLGAERKMLVLDDPGIGRFRIGVVHHGVALIVVGVQHLRLKADAAVLQGPQPVAKVGIHRAGVNHLVGQCVQVLPVGQIIHVQPHLDALQHLFHHGGIAAIGDALIQRVEIVVVVGKADRQAFDDESRQFGAGAAPLLAGVAFDELFVNVRAHQTDGLLLKIFRVGDARFPLLLLDLCLGLGGGHHTPHLIEGVHIEGQIVDLAVIVGNGAVGVAVELRKLVHILPHGLVVGVEDVGTVAVHIDALHRLGVDVARKYKEHEVVIDAIQSHHGDVEPKSIIACIVQAADAISAARPGARRENLESYIKRLEKLEEVASSFEGVERCFAIQAGREVRIMVKPEVVDDDQMILLARDICRKIESDLEYPGQIKVNMVRESRAVEYAK